MTNSRATQPHTPAPSSARLRRCAACCRSPNKHSAIHLRGCKGARPRRAAVAAVLCTPPRCLPAAMRACVKCGQPTDTDPLELAATLELPTPPPPPPPPPPLSPPQANGALCTPPPTAPGTPATPVAAANPAKPPALPVPLPAAPAAASPVWVECCAGCRSRRGAPPPWCLSCWAHKVRLMPR